MSVFKREGVVVKYCYDCKYCGKMKYDDQWVKTLPIRDEEGKFIEWRFTGAFCEDCKAKLL